MCSMIWGDLLELRDQFRALTRNFWFAPRFRRLFFFRFVDVVIARLLVATGCACQGLVVFVVEARFQPGRFRRWVVLLGLFLRGRPFSGGWRRSLGFLRGKRHVEQI